MIVGRGAIFNRQRHEISTIRLISRPAIGWHNEYPPQQSQRFVLRLWRARPLIPNPYASINYPLDRH